MKASKAPKPIEGFTRTGDGRVRCDKCGKVIALSGLGIGSHRRSHQVKEEEK